MTKRVRVVIVDDHVVVRSGLEGFLLAHADLVLVGEAPNGESAVTLCARVMPDVVLMDLMMPGMDGATATARILECCPTTRVIALTSFYDERLVQAALRAGATSYLLKNVTSSELATAIRSAAAGRRVLAPEAAEVLIRSTTREEPLLGPLTRREKDVLALMVDGLTNPQIAEILDIRRSTVKFHVSRILTKLSATSRTEAVSLAIQEGLLE